MYLGKMLCYVTYTAIVQLLIFIKELAHLGVCKCVTFDWVEKWNT